MHPEHYFQLLFKMLEREILQDAERRAPIVAKRRERRRARRADQRTRWLERGALVAATWSRWLGDFARTLHTRAQLRRAGTR